MKSKTKTILIFAAILAAVFLIAFLDGGAVQSAADEEEAFEPPDEGRPKE